MLSRGNESRVSKRRLTIRIAGATEDGGYPRLGDFLKELDAIRTALKRTQEIASEEGREVYYRIVALSMASPATVVLEETPTRIDGKRGLLPKTPVSSQLVSTLRQIETRGTVPAKLRDLATLEAYRTVGALLSRRGEQVTIANANTELAITSRFTERIDKIIGPDQIIHGSVTGVLLAVNLHNTTRFEIYPPVGPKKIACDFDSSLKRDVIAGLDRNVRVVGKLRYKHWSDFPHAISVDELEVFPPDNELPTLTSLCGLAHRQPPPGHGQEA